MDVVVIGAGPAGVLAAARAADLGAHVTLVTRDAFGGMAANDWMAQDIADITGLPVVRPDFVETTALGAAMLAAVGAGLHASLEHAVETMIGPERRFEPNMAQEIREKRLAAWAEALASV